MYSSTLPSTSALDGGGWSAPRPGRFTPGKDPVPTVHEAGWAPGPVWTGAENLVPTEIRSLDRPARSESIYRPSYLGPQILLFQIKIAIFLKSLTRYFIICYISPLIFATYGWYSCMSDEQNTTEEPTSNSSVGIGNRLPSRQPRILLRFLVGPKQLHLHSNYKCCPCYLGYWFACFGSKAAEA